MRRLGASVHRLSGFPAASARPAWDLGLRVFPQLRDCRALGLTWQPWRGLELTLSGGSLGLWKEGSQAPHSALSPAVIARVPASVTSTARSSCVQLWLFGWFPSSTADPGNLRVF